MITNNYEGSDLAPIFEIDMPTLGETEFVMPEQRKLEVGERHTSEISAAGATAGKHVGNDVTVSMGDYSGGVKEESFDLLMMMMMSSNNNPGEIDDADEEEPLSPITPMSPFYFSANKKNHHHYAGAEKSFTFPGNNNNNNANRCHDEHNYSPHFMTPRAYESPSLSLPDLCETSSEGSLASIAGSSPSSSASTQEEFKQRFLASCSRGASNSVNDIRKAFDATRRMETQRFEPGGAARRVRFFPHVVVIACKRAKAAPSDLWYQDEDYMKFHEDIQKERAAATAEKYHGSAQCVLS